MRWVEISLIGVVIYDVYESYFVCIIGHRLKFFEIVVTLCFGFFE